MKFVRVLLRLIILLVVAAAFVKLTAIYGYSTHPALFSARYQDEQRHHQSAPKVGYVTDFFGYGIMFAVFCYAARMLFRVRLNPARRGEGQPVLLGLLQLRQQSLKSLPVPDDSPPPLRC